MTAPSPNPAIQEALRALPSVDATLKQPRVIELLDQYPRAELLHALRSVLAQRRSQLRGGHAVDISLGGILHDVRKQLRERARPRLRRVINATGIVLHTNLGRAPLPEAAIDAMADVAAGYSTVELDLATGRRGDRQGLLRELLCELTGAADALLVNNNAAATFLTLHALARNQEVVISRGQLVEIGGSYRLPDIIDAAGCRLREVGTTNRTHLRDYQTALDKAEHPRALLRVHPSNYQVRGFAKSVPTAGLVELATTWNQGHADAGEVLVIDDLGSGLLRDDIWQTGESSRDAAAPDDDPPLSGEFRPAVEPSPPEDDTGHDPTAALRAALAAEPTVAGSLAAGADVVLFSGDKLLGGPQAGVILGRPDLLQKIRQHPLMRTYRPDKLTLAGLEATLRLYRDRQRLGRELPVARMLSASMEDLQQVAHALADRLGHIPSLRVVPTTDETFAGGGSLPDLSLPTWTVRLETDALRPDALAAALRTRPVPIIGRIQRGAVVLDCRTLDPDDLEEVAGAVEAVVRRSER